MKLYTRTGDDGTTGLIGGGRASKTSIRVHAYGDVDELNAVLGWCAVGVGDDLGTRLHSTQSELFVIGAELACANPNSLPAGFVPIDETAVARLESWIDEACAVTPELSSFILPGGSEGAARLHLARAVCRRAERAVVELAGTEPINVVVVHYLNRLSDLLFAWARLHNHDHGAPEIPWRP